MHSCINLLFFQHRISFPSCHRHGCANIFAVLCLSVNCIVSLDVFRSLYFTSQILWILIWRNSLQFVPRSGHGERLIIYIYIFVKNVSMVDSPVLCVPGPSRLADPVCLWWIWQLKTTSKFPNNIRNYKLKCKI